MALIIEECIDIYTEDSLTLEGILAYPDDGIPPVAWLLLSPHPHLGGRMDNNVISRLAQRGAESGAATLRFNYRGVGNSEIRLGVNESVLDYWTIFENERRYAQALPDIIAAAGCLRSILPNARLAVVGYSLGAILAGMAHSCVNPAAIVAVAPPTLRVPLDCFRDCQVPKAFITGDNDFAFVEEGFQEQFLQLPDAKCQIRLPGCDHFYRGKEDMVSTATVTFMSEVLSC